jgi:acetyl/propionyl-CoA carboxylase alpha subunit
VAEGDVAGVDYDPLLAKVIASAPTREAAIRRASAALRRFPILGIRTNVAFLLDLIEHDAFNRGAVHTAFIDEELPPPAADDSLPAEALAAAALARPERTVSGAGRPDVDPWSLLAGWGR